jgi:zinc protease
MRLASEPVPEAELRKAKNQLSAELIRNLKTVNGKANQLGFFETVLGDYRAMFGLEAAWERIDAGAVQRAAAVYLQPARRTVVVLEPVASGRPVKAGPPRPGGVS